MNIRIDKGIDIMARDKLITIRIEGEKRKAFGELAKSQNTDTASLLYDFINQCLDGRIDIKLVTGKGNRLDKIDNQLDTNRLDKLEATTQEIDERVGSIAKKLTDWIEAIDDRLNDCDQGLSEKITSLENRLNALSSQLDSQRIDSEIGSIDTDSQLDRQRENPDMEPLTKEALRLDHLDDQRLIDAIESQIEETTEKDEADYELNSSINELDKGAIGPVRGDSPQLKLSEAVDIGDKPWYTIDELLDCHYSGWPKTKEGLRKKALTECWPRRTQRGSKGNPYEYQAILPN